MAKHKQLELMPMGYADAIKGLSVEQLIRKMYEKREEMAALDAELRGRFE